MVITKSQPGTGGRWEHETHAIERAFGSLESRFGWIFVCSTPALLFSAHLNESLVRTIGCIEEVAECVLVIAFWRPLAHTTG